MPLCDLCGKEADLFRAEIEGSELAVCEKCGKFGQIISKVKTPAEIKKILVSKQPSPFSIKEEIEEIIASDYAQKIRQAREKRSLTQKDFAKLLNEKESLLEKWEKGLLAPSLEAARKLEKLLALQLVEKLEEQKVAHQKTSSEEMTLGDVIKIRKRKSN